MKIVTPLSDVNHYIPLVEAGAGEFYCGITPLEWLKKYNMTIPINRREWLLSSCNISTYTSIKIISKMVQDYHVPVKITLNAHYYLQEQYSLLLEIIKKLMDIGIDTFIIADMAFIMYLRENDINCKIHLSGEAEVINHLSMTFFDRLNIARYIFPRKITLDDMKATVKNFGMKREYEAFYLNSFCQYSGGFCNSVHCDYLPTTCWLPYKIVLRDEKNDKFKHTTRALKLMGKALRTDKKNDSEIYPYAQSGCGICRIRDLSSIGIEYLKIVGRGHDLASLQKDIQFANQIANASNSKNTKAEDIAQEYFNGNCPDRCYYPENLHE